MLVILSDLAKETVSIRLSLHALALASPIHSFNHAQTWGIVHDGGRVHRGGGCIRWVGGYIGVVCMRVMGGGEWPWVHRGGGVIGGWDHWGVHGGWDHWGGGGGGDGGWVHWGE